MPTTTVLVIDVQESALPGCFDVEGLVATINGLTARSRSAGCPVVFIQHEDPDDPEVARDTPGWQLAAALDRDDHDLVVAKTYRDAFAATVLDDVLRSVGATRLVVAGVHSDLCVLTTSLSALQHGYDVTLVADAHQGLPTELPSGALSSRSITELVNARFAALRHPGRRIEVVPAAEVSP